MFKDSFTDSVGVSRKYFRRAKCRPFTTHANKETLAIRVTRHLVCVLT